jgi:xylulose-5-phosphate/fructose-6-phosphate phosphoketolase
VRARRISHEELDHLIRGYGYEPYFVEGNDPRRCTRSMAGALDKIVHDLKRIRPTAQRDGGEKRPMWPMIVLRTPKGWTVPEGDRRKRTEDYWRSHQVPMGDMNKPEHIKILEQWMKS